MNRKTRNNSGFSLVELLIAITMLTILVIPLAMNLVSVSKVNGKAKRTLYATEMAQNIFEGITASNPHGAMMELSSGGAASGLSFLPSDFEFSSAGESTVAVTVDGNTGKNVPQINNGEFVIEPTTQLNSYVAHGGFVGNADMIYSFWIDNVKQKNDNEEYDVRMTFIGSNNNQTTLQSLSSISSVNPSYDSVYMDGITALENVLSTEYRYKRLAIDKTEAELLSRMQRNYVIDIHNIGLDPAGSDREIVVDIKTEYEYKYVNSDEITNGYSAQYEAPIERIFSSASYGQDPRNIFIYYTPNYFSNSTSNLLDNFKIINSEDLEVNVYIIRMQQDNDINSVLGTNNNTDNGRESAYSARVSIEETQTDEINTSIRTNMDENISVSHDEKLDDWNSKRTGATARLGDILYEFNSPDPSFNIDNELDVRSLDAQRIQNLAYDITVEIYTGDTYPSDVNDPADVPFSTKDRVAKFNGRIVQ